MLKSIEATVEVNREVRLREPIHVKRPRRAIVTIFDEPNIPDTALLSQESLARDWERPEEDAPWSHLR
uniref:Uncharacterized protein n=1 Tax=Candidatus Kentrum sp. FM TaxID=2126340 RepID=A0A450TTF5_9GAMM|nr:MAG: hypothetical protein BECKFM1743A_GA0114220_106113 [Candidatus Kentron sp. FM]VFJ72414.1 MAG: hypothetical protein BECKFM1743C_GA0114222_106523 [Candidatus Kentron sp. FM]VFK19435.1 MAG: hypothetical protein BECKFM1743B_GA0114221_106194 [Candidatus Kentron sp. FM]